MPPTRCPSVNGNRLSRLCAAGFAAALGAAALPACAAPMESQEPLLQQELTGIAGKTMTAVRVVFPPGARAMPHRHGMAFLYAYVLNGAIRSQIEGQPARLYQTGESWTERPGDHHVLTENTSASETARLLVVFVADTAAALKTDDATKEP